MKQNEQNVIKWVSKEAATYSRINEIKMKIEMCNLKTQKLGITGVGKNMGQVEFGIGNKVEASESFAAEVDQVIAVVGMIGPSNTVD